jgi:hypothetical protein
MDRRIASLALLLGALLLAACGPAPFEPADLGPALFQEGDLPPAWAEGQDWDTMVGDPTIRHFAAGRELHGPATGGRVSVGLYRSREDAVEALVWMLQVTPAGAAPVLVGDAGFASQDSLIFRRGLCLAVISLDAADTQTPDLLKRYGQRLDGRIRALGCDA